MASKTISAAVLRAAVPDLTTIDCPCGPIQPAVRIDGILEVIRPLAKPRATWAEGDVLRVIPVMRNRMCFILGGCSAEASALWGEWGSAPCLRRNYSESHRLLLHATSASAGLFEPEWLAYLDESPAVMELVDPIYVCYAFPPGGIPAGFATHAATADPRAGAAAALCANGVPSECLFVVNSIEWAAYFVGYMHGAFAGLQSHRLTAAHVIAY